MRKFLSCKLKRKVVWETFLVALYRLKQNLGWNSIQFRKLLVGQNFLAANQKNEVLNPLQRNYFCAFAHIVALLITLKSQFVTSSLIIEPPNWH